MCVVLPGIGVLYTTTNSFELMHALHPESCYVGIIEYSDLQRITNGNAFGVVHCDCMAEAQMIDLGVLFSGFQYGFRMFVSSCLWADKAVEPKCLAFVHCPCETF